MNSDVGGQVKYIITAEMDEFSSKLADASKALDRFAKNLDNESSDAGTNLGENIDKGAKKAEDSITRLESKTTKSLKNITSALGSIGFGAFTAAATGATGALTGLVTKGMSVGSSLESNRLSFEALTGSVEKAEYVLSNVADFAQKNPFQMLEVSDTAKELVAMGRQAAQIPGDLEKIGAVAVATGADLGSLGHVFGQISAQGKMMTQDMYQLVNQGVAIMPALEKVTGKTGQALKDFISQGSVTLDIFEKALGQVVDPEKYNELLEKMNNTIPRQLDRLKGSIVTFATSLVGIDKFTGQKLENGLAQTYTNILKKLADALRNSDLIAAVQRFGQSIAKVVDKFVPLLDKLAPALTKVFDFLSKHTSALIPILGGVLVLVGKLGSNIPVLGGVIQSVTGSFGKLKDGILGLAKANPLLAAGLGLLIAGFISAYKNSEEFRAAISTLLQSVTKLAQKLLPAFKQIGQAFVQIITSPAVIQIMVTLANVISGLADAIASLPTGLFTQFITTLITMAAINKNKFLGIGGGILYIITSVQQLYKLTDGFKNLPEILSKIGHNIMTGLLNGLVKGAQAVIQFCVVVANSIIEIFKSVLGIHSPSKVMRQLGQYTTLGLAKGITDKKSAAQLAMDNLATDILNRYKTVMNDMNDFDMIPDLNTEYNYWKAILSNFTEGSEQYLEVLDQMKDVRKQINKQIVDLAKEYNENLDSTVSRIANSYGRFDVVNRTKPSDIIFPENIIRNTQRQVANMEAWAEAQEQIRKSPLDPKLIEELGTYGVDSLYDLQAIAQMTDEQLSEFNKMWLRQQEIAEKEGIAQMATAKDDTLKQVAELSKGLEGQVSSVAEEGGRLVTSFGDNMVDALPTLADAYSQWDDYLAKATAELAKSGSGSGSTAGVDTSIPDLVNEAMGGLNKDNLDLNGVEASAEEIAEQLVMGIAGVLGGFALMKFAPKLAQGLSKGLKGLFKSKEVAQAAASAGSEGSSTIINSFGNTINNAAPTLTKGQQLMKTMRSALLNLILLAGVIAAFAAALWVVNTLIPDDFGALIPKIVMVGVVATAFGALGVILTKVGGIDTKAVLMLTALAGDIALFAAALWVVNTLIPDDFGNLVGKIVMVGVVAAAFGALAAVAGIEALAPKIAVGLILMAGIAVDLVLLAGALALVNAMIPDDFGNLAGKIAMVGVVVAAFAVLAGVMGIAPIAIAIGIGLVLLAGLAVDIVLLASALALVNAVLPDDFDGLIAKIQGMRACLDAMIENMGLGQLIGAFMAAVSMPMIAAVVGMYTFIALQLKVIEAINLDVGTITNKIKTIKECMEIVSANDDQGIFGLFKGIIKNFLNTVNVAEAAATVGLYATIARELNTIESIELHYDTIKGKIEVLKSIVDLICGTGTGSVGEFLSQAFGAFLEHFKTDQAASVVKTYTEMIENLNKIQEAEIDKGVLEQKLEILKEVVKLVTDTGDSGVFKLLAEAIKSALVADSAENASKIFQAYSVIADAIDNIKNKIPADMTEVNARIKNIETVIGNLRDADLSLDNAEDKEYRIGMATSMLYKFGEAGNAVNQLPALNDGWKDNIINIRDAIYEVGQVNQAEAIENKEYIVGVSQSIINKFSEIAPVLNNMEIVGEDVKSNLIRIRDCLYEVGQINEVDGLDNKISVAEKSITLLRHLTEFSQVASTVVTLEQGTFDVISKICEVINTSITRLVSDLNGQIPNFIQFGSEMANAIQRGWDSRNVPQFFDKATQKILTQMDKFARQMDSKGSSAASAYIKGFREKNMPSALETIGRQTGEGFANGLSGTVGRINRAMGELSSAAITRLKVLLGIASPSKVFYKLGTYTGEGLVYGLLDQVDDVRDAAEEIADAIRSPFEGLDDFTASITGTNNSGVGSSTHNTTINQNNIINNGADYSTMMADLKWALFTA